MEREQHLQRHKELHRAFDELFADYIAHHPEQVTFMEMPIQMLMNWSYKQTLEPDELNESHR